MGSGKCDPAKHRNNNRKCGDADNIPRNLPEIHQEVKSCQNNYTCKNVQRIHCYGNQKHGGQNKSNTKEPTIEAFTVKSDKEGCKNQYRTYIRYSKHHNSRHGYNSNSCIK